jgi:hypothetical protein
MAELFPNVWYATPARAASLTKLVVFDDSGSLEVSPQESFFSGRRGRIDLGSASVVSLTRQRLPWVIYALINAALVPPLLLFPWFLLGSRLDFTSGFGLVVVVGLVAVMIASNAIGMLVGINTPWVLVEYEDKDGQFQQAYLADASGFGWGGIFGGTKRIYQAIASSIDREPSVRM